MNRDQWRGGLKQLRGSIKKQWGRLTGNSLLVTMGELERLLGVFQRQYGHLKSRDHRSTEKQRAEEKPPAKHALRLIQGRRRSRPIASRMKAASSPLQPS